jgi:hypothetical protein
MSGIFSALINLPTRLLRAMSENAESTTDDYQPTPLDVVAVKKFFSEKYTLPTELLDAIIDFAMYWPHTTTKLAQATSIRSGAEYEDQMLVVIPHAPCPRLFLACI